MQVHTPDAPLLHPGDDEILFLRATGRSGDDDVYVTLSGPSGRLRVAAGTVRLYPGTSLTEGLPTTVDAVTARIRGHAATGGSR
ncbi:hypothetical protein GCM10011512_06620 [Tersicoccus solisilvae]|uniref:Uncharacterized protein n=1 Tax=Tersicoccus solisilvae TaxID=1882339 RepID=A0ABQ1NPX0_9MICC|nr:hypothetical protein [Tersicoccus solisilvae]GGC82556.1 hypothetical protein GCM10011512_06620 [Tersicoccus solisilvae]